MCVEDWFNNQLSESQALTIITMVVLTTHPDEHDLVWACDVIKNYENKLKP